MDDPYVHILVGPQAPITGVYDVGNVMCNWDCGSSLSLAYGADCAHKIRTENEAKVTLEWYVTKQPEKDSRCPRCGQMLWGPMARHALSRFAAKLSGKEAIFAMGTESKYSRSHYFLTEILFSPKN